MLPAGGFGTPPNGAATTGIYFNPATLTNGTFNNLTGVYTSDGSGYCTLNDRRMRDLRRTVPELHRSILGADL